MAAVRWLQVEGRLAPERWYPRQPSRAREVVPQAAVAPKPERWYPGRASPNAPAAASQAVAPREALAPIGSVSLCSRTGAGAESPRQTSQPAAAKRWSPARGACCRHIASLNRAAPHFGRACPLSTELSHFRRSCPTFSRVFSRAVPLSQSALQHCFTQCQRKAAPLLTYTMLVLSVLQL